MDSRKQAGRKTECPSQERLGTGMEANLAGGLQDGADKDQRHLPKGLRQPPKHPTKSQFLGTLSDHGLKYYQDREDFRTITLIGKKTRV